MEGTSADVETTPTSKQYTSRPGALVWFFRKSRDRWKSKYQELKDSIQDSIKGYKNRVADLTKSREQWKLKAAQAAEQAAALETEVAALRAQIAVHAAEKKKAKASPR